RPHLHPGARILVLTPDGEGPQAVAALLNENGFGASKLTILEALGGQREKIRSVRAADFSFIDVDVLNVVALELEATAGALLIARHAAHGGELVRIALSRADPVGGMTGWRPAMPVTQWVWTKP